MSELLQILTKLISFKSITPEDEGCQDFMLQYLQQLGFSCLRFDNPPVSNFFAYCGTDGPLLVFAGHTDVVPTGPLEKWNSCPFTLTHKDNLLYGRGVADMKGSLACMLHMAKRWVSKKARGRLGFLITSGEEGDHYDLGTPYVMQQLKERGFHIDYCIVGEPSSQSQVGDVIKIGRRGSLNIKISLHGRQGHVAYPDKALNPIHQISPVLAELCAMKWDQGNASFSPTSLQLTGIHSGGSAPNVIPGELLLKLNIRFSTEQTSAALKEKINKIFKSHHLNPEIEYRISGEPFLTDKGLLLETSIQTILEKTGIQTQLSTSGGTSDGRFIAPYGVEVVEIGPVNASIHQINENVALRDLELLEEIYLAIAEKLI